MHPTTLHSLGAIGEGDGPFAMIKKRGGPVDLFQGSPTFHDSLADMPRHHGIPDGGDTVDTIGALPFHTVRERGFPARSAGEPITMLHVESHMRGSLHDVLALLPDEDIAAGTPIFDTDSAAYQDIVRHIQSDEIGKGEGSNFVIANAARFHIEDMSRAKALSIFRRLLETEFGAYMHFLYYDGSRYLVGASPERHLSVRKGEVIMNPISGTFRKEGRQLLEQFKADLIKFLGDEKETKELFKVLDEELKMMSQMCEEGGCIVGPLLKEMLRVIHTEYELIGHSRKSIADLLRTSMFAPTVTGGPVGNACRIIEKYETTSRGYYSGALTVSGRDDEGGETLDSGILIRMAEITPEGQVTARAGATIVQDSDPASEDSEVHAKLAGLLGAFRDEPRSSRASVSVPVDLSDDEDIREALVARNERLSDFFLRDQQNADLTIPELLNTDIVIIDNGDDFCRTLEHMIVRMGANVTVVNFDEYASSSFPCDVVLIGPGPGDPKNESDVKMQKVFQIVSELRDAQKPMLGVCLGHQILCRSFGMDIVRKSPPTQGEQQEIEFFGEPRTVGSYNAFEAKRSHISGIDVSADEETGGVHGLRGPGIESMQFHPESVLTKKGFELLSLSLVRLVTEKKSSKNRDDYSDTRLLQSNAAWLLE